MPVYPHIGYTTSMPMQSYQPLRVLLYAGAVVEAVAGVVLIFATEWVLSSAPKILVFPYSGYVVALVKGVGILVLALAYLLCVTARDPVRYVAVLDTLAFICFAAAALNVYGVVALHLGMFYPGPYLLVRAAFQVALGVAIVAMRPKRAPKAGST
ncbi:MAG TPA: hypothetical protein VGZ02_08455 [Candidatus Baltobacteraceae bacterium]|jgi:hypothetical protein|nr:hypothetical protein [Candidatus Baltobacteraceae bacterium]